MTKDLESIVAAIESLRGVVEQLVDSVTSMRKVLDATNSKVERLATRRPAAKETAARDTTSEFGDKLAELTHQVELLRKRVSLRARSEQLSAEAAERIAAAVIDSLADTIPEAGPRLRSRRRSARS